MIRDIKRSATQPEVASALLADIEAGPGIRYAEEKMAEYRDRAIAMLEDLPASPAREALAKLVHFTTSRRK